MAPDPLQRSQSRQAGPEDGREAQQDEEGRGLREVGGAFKLHLYGKVFAYVHGLPDRSNRSQSEELDG